MYRALVYNAFHYRWNDSIIIITACNVVFTYFHQAVISGNAENLN